MDSFRAATSRPAPEPTSTGELRPRFRVTLTGDPVLIEAMSHFGPSGRVMRRRERSSPIFLDAPDRGVARGSRDDAKPRTNDATLARHPALETEILRATIHSTKSSKPLGALHTSRLCVVT